jgi:hypothetical protein
MASDTSVACFGVKVSCFSGGWPRPRYVDIYERNGQCTY